MEIIVLDLLLYSVSFHQGKAAKSRSVTAVALYSQQADENLKIEIFKQALVLINKLEHLSNSHVNFMIVCS